MRRTENGRGRLILALASKRKAGYLMKYDLTKAEERKLRQILEASDQNIRNIEAQLATLKEGTPEYAALHKKGMTAQVEQLSIVLDYTQACYVKRFKKLGTDAAAILEDGKETAAYILQDEVKSILEGRTVLNKPIEEKINAAWLVKDIQNTAPLTLHYEALQGNKEALEELTGYIVEIVIASPYTTEEQIAGGAEIISSETAGRRLPLEVIKLYGILNDKATTQLINTDGFTQELNGQLRLTWGANQAPAKKDPVPTYIALTYEGTAGHLNKRLTAFDKAVYEAVATSFFYHKQENGSRAFYITPQEVWRIMNGTASTSKTPSAKQVERVCSSLDDMRFTRFYMDITAELDANYLTMEDERIVNGIVDTYLLKADRVEFTTDKGRKITGYRVTDEPILYSYNKAKGHLVLVPYELLDTSDSTGNEGNTIEFRNYLLQQIGLMYEGQRNNSRILYSTLYRDTGTQPPEKRLNPANYSTETAYKRNIRKEAQRDRDKINALLDAWKAKDWIKGYKLVKKGQAYIGVDIALNPEKKQRKQPQKKK